MNQPTRSWMQSLKVLGSVLVGGMIIAWVVLSFVGCKYLICWVLGVHSYKVETLSEYAEYIAGADLYTAHRAVSLSFACDSLRDQFTAYLHKTMVADAPPGMIGAVREEVVRLGLLGARREVHVLHLVDNVNVGEEGLDLWARQMRSSLEQDPEDKKEGFAIAGIRRLFDRVVLHAGDRQVVVPVTERFTCDGIYTPPAEAGRHG